MSACTALVAGTGACSESQGQGALSQSFHSTYEPASPQPDAHMQDTRGDLFLCSFEGDLPALARTPGCEGGPPELAATRGSSAAMPCCSAFGLAASPAAASAAASVPDWLGRQRTDTSASGDGARPVASGLLVSADLGAAAGDSHSYTIFDLDRTWAMFFLRLFHAWIFFIATVVLTGYGLNTFLSMFLQFTTKLNQEHQLLEREHLIQLIRLSTRAFLLVLLWAGAVQCGVWLFLDCFATDMFLSYRRVLCLEGAGPGAWFLQFCRVKLRTPEDRDKLLAALMVDFEQDRRRIAVRDTVEINGVRLSSGWEVVLTGDFAEAEQQQDQPGGTERASINVLMRMGLPCTVAFSTGSCSVRTAAFEGADGRGRVRAWWDVVIQCIIFLSLDVYPFCVTFWSLGGFESLVTTEVIATLASRSIGVAFCHIVLYLVCSTLVDYYWKICALVTMTADFEVHVLPWVPEWLRRWHARAVPMLPDGPTSPSGMESEVGMMPPTFCVEVPLSPSRTPVTGGGVEASPGGWSRLTSDGSCQPRRPRTHTDGAMRSAAMTTGLVEDASFRVKFASTRGDDLNLLVWLRKAMTTRICCIVVTLWTTLCCLVLFIVVAIPGLSGRPKHARHHCEVLLVLLGLLPPLALCSVIMPARWRRDTFRNLVDVLDADSHTKRTKCFKSNCGMRPNSMMTHAIMKLLVGVGFALFGYEMGIRGCIAFGSLLSIWNFGVIVIACRCRDWLWGVSLLQTALFGSCALVAAIFGRLDDLVESGYDSTLVLIFITQLGNWRMSQTKAYSCLKAFFVSMAFVIALLTMLSHSYDTGLVFGKPGLEFCLPDQIEAGTCIPVDFPLRGMKPGTRYDFCGMSWPMGRNTTENNENHSDTVSDRCHDHRLSIVDFGQLAAVAGYLPNMTRVKLVLHANLPGWSPLHHQVYNVTKGTHATFVHLRRGSTDIVAVRGTSSAIEALQDLNLWMPVAFLQIARSLGPSLYSTRSVLGTLMVGHHDYRSEAFDDLVKYVLNLTRTVGHKHTIYMTGHSLGGGLATVVATDVNISAVTFSAPGLGATSAIFHPKPHAGSLIKHSVNVVPDKDLVPQIDTQTGTVLRTRCPIQNPFGCHRLKVTICEILSACGDGGGRHIPRGYQRSCEACGHDAGLDIPKCRQRRPHPDPFPDPSIIIGPGPYIGPFDDVPGPADANRARPVADLPLAV